MQIQKIKNAIKELSKIGEISLEAGAQVNFAEMLTSFETDLAKSPLKLDILLLQEQEELLGYLPENLQVPLINNGFVEENHQGMVLRVFGPSKFPLLKINELQPTIKIIIKGNLELDDEEYGYLLERMGKNAALLILVSKEGNDKLPIINQQKETLWKIKQYSLEDFGKIEDFVNKIPDPILKSSLTVSGIFGLVKISEFLKIQIEHEQKDLDAKKISVNKELEAQKKTANSRPGQEVFLQIKNNLSKSASEFEKGIGERFGKITKVQEGSLFFKIEQEIALLKELEEIEYEGEILLRLPNSVDQMFYWIQQELKDHLKNDVISMNDFLAASMEEVADLLEKSGAQANNLEIELFDKNSIQPLLEHGFRFEKEFEAKGITKGFMSLFNAVRQPLFTLMSVYMILRFTPFKDDFDKYLEAYGLFVLIILLSLGLYWTITNLQKEKRRKMKEETKKAKQYLLAEVKRILTSVEREWKQPYNDFLKKQIRDLIETAENNLKNHSQKMAQESNDRNLLTQRKTININNLEKQLQLAIREKQNFDNKLNILMADTKIEFFKHFQ